MGRSFGIVMGTELLLVLSRYIALEVFAQNNATAVGLALSAETVILNALAVPSPAHRLAPQQPSGLREAALYPRTGWSSTPGLASIAQGSPPSPAPLGLHSRYQTEWARYIFRMPIKQTLVAMR